MLELCATRPSLAQPLRRAEARLDGKDLVLSVSPDFLAFATMHADEYKDLARKAAGHTLVIAIEAGAAAAEEEVKADPTEDEVRQQKLREEAEKEPAVQEALDLFDGRVVDVKEAKASREDA